MLLKSTAHRNFYPHPFSSSPYFSIFGGEFSRNKKPRSEGIKETPVWRNRTLQLDKQRSHGGLRISPPNLDSSLRGWSEQNLVPCIYGLKSVTFLSKNQDDISSTLRDIEDSAKKHFTSFHPFIKFKKYLLGEYLRHRRDVFSHFHIAMPTEHRNYYPTPFQTHPPFSSLRGRNFEKQREELSQDLKGHLQKNGSTCFVFHPRT